MTDGTTHKQLNTHVNSQQRVSPPENWDERWKNGKKNYPKIVLNTDGKLH